MPAEATSARSVIAERLIGEGVVVLALVAWWLAARGLPEFILPGPVAVGRRLVELFVTPEFLFHLAASTWRVRTAPSSSPPRRSTAPGSVHRNRVSSVRSMG